MSGRIRRDTDALPGWYGKVSSLGDFAHRRLSSEWITTCDRWLSGVLVESRARLGAGWLDTYLTAPLLCFAWTPGTMDDRWWFGVMMASCDKVGRYFPLVIAHDRPCPPLDRAGYDHLGRWYAGVAGAALMTLSDTSGSLDAMESALAALPLWPPPASDRAFEPVADDRTISPLACALGRWVAEQPMARARPQTAWWPFADDGAAPVVELNGLPDGDRFTRLLASAPSR